MGGRGRNYDKEYALLDKLKHENKKLKQEIQKLRKEFNKNKLHYENISDLLEQQAAEEITVVTEQDKEMLYKRWKCHSCQEGIMKLIIIPRLDGPRYFRKCTNLECGNRTKLKKYTEDVEGITDE